MLTAHVDQIRLLQQPGGRAFTEFVDSLIHAHARVAGIPDKAIATNLRTNIGDEGADTSVAQSDPSDTTGRFGEATVWQYKATSYKNVGTTKQLLKGRFLRERIIEGYAYRLAVADSITPAQRKRRTDALTVGCRLLNRKAPPALIVSADDLAKWIDQYLGLVIAWFFPLLRGDLMHLDAWGSGVTSVTPNYVSVPEWDGIEQRLRQHIDFSKEVPSVLSTVQGEAGVGKSRLVYELLASVSGMSGIAVYANDEDASLRVARDLANTQRGAAVLVADECGPEGRERLKKTLQGRRDRVRVIAIDNSGRMEASGDPEIWVDKMPAQSLEQVLEANFSHIDRERRRAYSELAKGYPRLASDLCAYDREIVAAGGDLRPAMPTVREFLRIRLTDAQRDALNAVALLNRVGFRGEVKGELDVLCSFAGIDAKITREALIAIQHGPGFVAQAGRYYYVTPEVIAQVAFDAAWDRWASGDPDVFLGRIPDDLLSAFLDRVRKSADKEVRRLCGDHFRHWASRIRSDELVDEQTTTRLVGLVDTNPDEYLGLVRRLIDEPRIESLADISGESRNGRWGPRRALVWMAERFARFPEYFDDAESILFRLGVAESEKQISNNATGIWAQLFRVYLSGTATPFPDRLARLRERLLTATPEVREVASAGMKAVFSSTATRMGGNARVAGRIPPEEWMPGSAAEEEASNGAALSFAAELAQSENPDMASVAIEAMIEQVRGFIARGYFGEIRSIFDRASLSDAQRIDLLESIDAVLLYDSARDGHDAPIIQSVRAWRDELVGSDLHSRMLSIVGKQRWGAARLRDDGAWQSGIDALAAEAIADPEQFRNELPWLFGPDAHSAGELGAALGLRDPHGSFLDDTLGNALGTEERAFARGYVSSLISRFPTHAGAVNEWLNAQETLAPVASADIAIAGGPATKALERSLRLYDRGVLPVGILYERNFLSDSEWLPDESYEELLVRVASAAANGEEAALRVGLDGLAMRFHGRPEVAAAMLERARTREAAWALVRNVASGARLTTYFWNDVLEALGRAEPRRAADVAAEVLIGESYGARGEAEAALKKIAEVHPGEVMESIGKVALDQSRGWVFHLAAFHGLIAALPADIVEGWIERVGPEGARRLARHLPPPHLVSGAPVVPPLTIWVLTRYADDDRVFREFSAGVHSFQVYHGDIAAQLDAEAEIARAFRTHPVARIRQWAEMEGNRALAEAERERVEEAEQIFPDN